MTATGADGSEDCAPRQRMSAAEIEAAVATVLTAASLEEKVAMMSGRGFFEQYRRAKGRWGTEPYRAGAGCERLGVPALWFTDGPRGVARGQSTCFPVSMARGASWDRDLERRIGEVMGIEARAQGCNLSGAVCINLLRHPGWGRAQETYGEDPFHVGEMGAALARGIQTHNVIATVKHFALNSMENARFKVDVRVDPRTLREVYLPHFRRVIAAGCASVMSAYNKVNGEYCGQNRALLTDILRHEWGFDGFVHSDWVLGVYQPYGAAAGLDIENPEPVHFGDKLVAAVNEGHIAPDVVDRACGRILRTLYRFAAAEDPLEDYHADLVACPAHVALAREAAEKSAVLLSNDGTLPLAKTSQVAVFGRLAGVANTGDHGSSRVAPPYVVTALEGIGAALGRPDLMLAGDESDPTLAAEAARAAEAAVVVVGYTADDEGEFIPGDISLGEVDLGPDANSRKRSRPRGGDRAWLRLPDAQVELIRAVAAANPRTVVVVVAGSAVVMSEWSDQTAAVLQTFYSGMEGGNALAALLFGEVSPSGKLPFTLARDESHYPFFDKDADSIEYGPLHGYTLLEQEGTPAHYPFGHGLSYARFGYRALRVRRAAGGIEATVSVRNDAAVSADEIVQLYVSFPGTVVSRPRKLLRQFQRLTLAPGQTRTVTLFVPDEDLTYWSQTTGSWHLEPGEHQVHIGGSSASEALLAASVAVI